MTAFWPIEMLVHGGFAASALAFLVRDILWLRLLAILSYGVFCAVAAARADGPAWSFIAWYALFIAINGGHAAYLFYERSLVRLNDEECRVRDLVFAALDPVTTKRLLRAGTWHDLPPGEFLTHERRVAKHLVLIAHGEVTVRVGNAEITRLGPGRFVGEIGFLTSGPATATAQVSSDGECGKLRCLAWNQRKLRKRLAHDDALRSVVYAAIGADLSAKIADDNVKVTRPAMPAMQAG